MGGEGKEHYTGTCQRTSELWSGGNKTSRIKTKKKNKTRPLRRVAVRSEPMPWFDHEKLNVYREAIDFIAWLAKLLETPVKLGDIRDQLDRASNSIALNIAEGNGKFTPRDRCRFFDTAHDSSLEFAAGLDILVARAKFTAEQVKSGKERLQRVVRMLMGLIKSNSSRDYGKFRPQQQATTEDSAPNSSS